MNTAEPRPEGSRTNRKSQRMSILWGRRRHEPFHLILGFALGVTLLVVALVTPTLRAATTTVDIVDFSYQPETVTIAVGDTITWTNRDVAAHTATASSNSSFTFDTGIIDNGMSASVQFTAAGTFEYICTLHPSMQGVVVVEGPPETEAVYLPLIQR